MSREKARGDQFERDVVKVLRANGHPYAERALRLGAHDDHGDIAGLPGFHLECKDHGRIELGAWLSLAAAEARCIASHPTAVLVVKRRMRPTAEAYTVMELGAFARLIADEVTA